MIRRAVGGPAPTPPLSPARSAREAAHAAAVRERDEAVAAVAAYCRDSLGYTRVETVDCALLAGHHLVLVRCGAFANPTVAFAVLRERDAGTVVEDGIEEHEYWERKADAAGIRRR